MNRYLGEFLIVKVALVFIKELVMKCNPVIIPKIKSIRTKVYFIKFLISKIENK